MDWPGEKVLTRVIDALENGIGGVLRPWQTRRVSRANAEARVTERLLLEQAELDIADIKAGRKRLDASGTPIALQGPPQLLLGDRNDGENSNEQETPSIIGFAHAAQHAAQAQDLQRAVNLKKVSLYAEEEAEEIDRQFEGAEPCDTKSQPNVDADWFTRWRIGAQDVSREEMQRLWGKLLAGEVAKPGSYTLHSVNFLSRMSSSDAELIARIAPFVTDGGIVKVGEDFFARHGLRFSDFLYLEDLGLINGTVGAGGLKFNLGQIEADGRSISTLAAGDLALVFDLGDPSNSPPILSLEVLTVTRVGLEILTLTSIPINLEYLEKICEKAISLGVTEVKMGRLHADRHHISLIRTMAKNVAQPPEAP